MPRRNTYLALFLLTLVASACGGSESTSSATDPSTETESTATSEQGEPAATGTEEASCSATDCSACLAIEGCSWTGGECARECLMDTFCVGPANPSAPACTHSVALLGEWQEDMGSAHDGVRVFVRATVELGPARFRRAMTFWDATEESAPVFRTNVLAPNDAHGSAEGSWQVEGDRLSVSYRPEGASEDTAEQYDIVSVSAERLELRDVAP